MKPLRSFSISLFNQAAQTRIGSYYANQVPAVGDQIHFFGHNNGQGDPFANWFLWRVDQVVWQVSSPGSRNAFDWAREADMGFDGSGVCAHVELLVWPTQGPHFAETPEWAKACAPPGYHGEEDEAAPVAGADPAIPLADVHYVDACESARASLMASLRVHGLGDRVLSEEAELWAADIVDAVWPILREPAHAAGVQAGRDRTLVGARKAIGDELMAEARRFASELDMPALGNAYRGAALFVMGGGDLAEVGGDGDNTP